MEKSKQTFHFIKSYKKRYNIFNIKQGETNILPEFERHQIVVRIAEYDNFKEIKAHNLTTAYQKQISRGHIKVIMGTYKDSFGNIQKSALATPGGVDISYEDLPKFNEIINTEEIKIIEEVKKLGIFEGNNQLDIRLSKNLESNFIKIRKTLQKYNFNDNSIERQSLEDVVLMSSADKLTMLSNLEISQKEVMKLLEHTEEGTLLRSYCLTLIECYCLGKLHINAQPDTTWKNSQSNFIVSKEEAEKNTKYMFDNYRLIPANRRNYEPYPTLKIKNIEDLD